MLLGLSGQATPRAPYLLFGLLLHHNQAWAACYCITIRRGPPGCGSRRMAAHTIASWHSCLQGRIVDVYVLKRPFVDHFLRAVGQRFEVRRACWGPAVVAHASSAGGSCGIHSGSAESEPRLLHPTLCSAPGGGVCTHEGQVVVCDRQCLQVVVFTASLGKYADPLLDLLDKVGGWAVGVEGRPMLAVASQAAGRFLFGSEMLACRRGVPTDAVFNGRPCRPMLCGGACSGRPAALTKAPTSR